MPIEPLIKLATGANQPADTAVFRVGIFAAYAIVGPDASMSVSAPSYLDISYPSNSLPVCTMRLPIGTKVGARAAADVALADEAELEALKKQFKKYTKVSVVLGSRGIGAEDMGGVLREGQYLVFKGYVSSLQVTASGDESVALEVRLAHEFINVANGAQLFSSFVSSNGFADFKVLAPGLAVSDQDLSAVPAEPWKLVLAIAGFTALNTANAINANVKPWVSRDPETLKLFELVKTSSKGLDYVLSKAVPRYDVPDVKTRFIIFIREMLLQAKSNRNFLNSAITLAESLFCSVAFTSDEGHFIPLDPFWHSKDMKVVRAGMSFDQRHYIGSGNVWAPEGYDVSGTVVVPPLVQGFFPDGGAAIYGSWRIPEADLGSPFALIDVAQYPAWLRFPGVLAAKNKQRLEGQKPSAYATPGAAPAPDAAAITDATAVREISVDYAFFNTWRLNLGNTSFEFTTGPRNDIVQGMNIAVETRNADGSSYTVYGMVDSTQLIISVDSKTAHLVVRLRYVRGEPEQAIIDKEGRDHFAWLRVADYLNGLRLW